MTKEELNKIRWLKKYELAKIYYEEKGDLEVPISYVTEDGTRLGIWIYDQRQAYHKKGTWKINEEQINLLKQIGMRFNLRDNDAEWNKKYELAKTYYEKNNTLKMKDNFKTKNGIDYDNDGIELQEWLHNQKSAYSGIGRFKITDRQIKLLEDIDIVWFRENTDKKLQLQEITKKNRLKKQKEILHRFYSLLNQYKEDDLPSKDELNNEFIRQLTLK